MDNFIIIPKEDLIETFHSWQGEGNELGRKSLFVRFKKCNLKCSFCDTMFKMESSEHSCKDFTRNDLLSAQLNGEIIVVTGGEPFLYDNLLESLLENADLIGFKQGITIETNGTLINHDKLDRISGYKVPVNLSISPKTYFFTDNIDKITSELKFIQNALNDFPDIGYIYKFVVDSKFQRLYGILMSMISKEIINPNNIYLMPIGESQTEVLLNTPKTFTYARKLGVNVTTRLHILGLVL